MSNIEVRPTCSRSTSRIPVVFLHIPKSAGTTVRRAIQQATGATNVVEGFDLSCFGDAFADRSADLPYRSSFFLSPAEFPKDPIFFSGHIAFSSLAAAYPRARLFTILREPRSRIVSTWLFWRSYSDSILEPWGEWGRRMRLSREPLSQFLADPRIACQTDNLALRLLVWPHPRLPDAGFIPPAADEELLDAAHRALKRMDFVGCVEDPMLMSRLSNFLGADVSLGHSNATAQSLAAPRPLLADELDTATMALLSDRSRLDAALWLSVVVRLGWSDTAGHISEASLLRQVIRYISDGVAYGSRGHRDAAIQYAETVAELERVRAEAAAARDASCREAARAEAALDHIRALEASTSWRLTAPLRAGKDRIRRLLR